MMEKKVENAVQTWMIEFELERRHVTQQQLARKMGIPPETLSRAMNAHKVLKKAMKALDSYAIKE
jgi:plasmid maintenance system antidote protein VapI